MRYGPTRALWALALAALAIGTVMLAGALHGLADRPPADSGRSWHREATDVEILNRELDRAWQLDADRSARGDLVKERRS